MLSGSGPSAIPVMRVRGLAPHARTRCLITMTAPAIASSACLSDAWVTIRVSSSKSAAALVEVAGHRVPRERPGCRGPAARRRSAAARASARASATAPTSRAACPARPARRRAGSGRRPRPARCRSAGRAPAPPSLSPSRSSAVRGHHSGDERHLAGVHEQRRVAEPTRHRQRLVDERAPLVERRGVVELVGEAEHAPAPQRRVLGRQGVEAAPERGDDLLVDLAAGGRLPERALGGGDRGLRDQERVADLAGDARWPARRWRSARPTSPPSGTPPPAP